MKNKYLIESGELKTVVFAKNPEKAFKKALKNYAGNLGIIVCCKDMSSLDNEEFFMSTVKLLEKFGLMK